MGNEIKILISRLLAHQWLHRSDKLVQRALTDEAFREELDQRLDDSGLQLLENPYAEYVTLALAKGMEQPVLGDGDNWISNTWHLERDQIALLVVLWALIILPKRQRQVERSEAGEEGKQQSMFVDEKKIQYGRVVAPPLSKKTIMADFGNKLGAKTRFDANLGALRKLGFITGRMDEIYEGPLLDLVFEYTQMARRILDGAMVDILGRHLSDVIKNKPEEEEETADV